MIKNRIQNLFEQKKQNILSVFFTAGHPSLHSVLPILEALEHSGVDMVEIGMPYSDPIADGPVIQQSSSVALENGMNLDVLFDMLIDARPRISLPLILMGYLNPVLQFGIEKFCLKCEQAQIDGLILPDLPLYEYEKLYKPIFDKHGLFNVFLITPQTSQSRIEALDKASQGFLYVVSSSQTTGSASAVSQNQTQYFEKLATLGLLQPRLIGFGIQDNPSFSRACAHANGAIVGSAFIKQLEGLSEPEQIRLAVSDFVGMIRGKI